MTGGGSGTGRAVVSRYIAEGARVGGRGVTGGGIVTVDAGAMLRMPRPRSPHGGR